jgi:hypothetical protein
LRFAVGLAVITAGAGLVPAAAASAATQVTAAPVSAARPASGAAANSPAGGDPSTTVTFTVTTGALTMTAPAGADLGSGAPGSIITGTLGGAVTVTDDRAALSAAWTATADMADWTTGAGGPTLTIPATDTTYNPGPVTVTGTVTALGSLIALAGSAATVVTGSGSGDSTATWDPAIAVTVPPTAVSGLYTSTLTQSVS